MSETVTDLPEPGGVAGVDRSGDLLVSLDDACMPMVDALGAAARHLLYATMGNTHPAARAIFERTDRPGVGDLVVVRDSIGHRDPDTRRRGLGYVVQERPEYATTRSVWERERAESPYLTDADRLIEYEAWYIQYGPHPADVCRWTNCDVMALPGPGDQWYRI